MLGVVGLRALESDGVTRPRQHMAARIEQAGTRTAGADVHGEEMAVARGRFPAAARCWLRGARLLTCR